MLFPLFFQRAVVVLRYLLTEEIMALYTCLFLEDICHVFVQFDLYIYDHFVEHSIE